MRLTTFHHDIVSEFLKDKKSLKIQEIDSDFRLFEQAFSALKIRLPGLVQISGLEKKGIRIPIYKARKFRCKSMNVGSNSGVRVILAYFKEKDTVVYIETYKKNSQENHDENRILKYFKGKIEKDFV